MWRLLLVVSLLSCSCEGSVTCRDENDDPVDWYILYKTPRNTNERMDGLDYMYIYPGGPQNQATSRTNNKTINAPDGILANTLAPMLTNNVDPNIRFISYSDQPPAGCPSGCASNGHSKGVVIVDYTPTNPLVPGSHVNPVDPTNTGIWLLHSTPKFPERRTTTGFYPKTGIPFAQTFICVTFNINQFHTIGLHLQYINAYRFDSHPPTFSLVNRKRKVYHNTLHNQRLTSSGGKAFHSIAKPLSAQADGGDLYVRIAGLIRSHVNVQTWGRQKDRDGSFCVKNRYHVLNVREVTTVLGTWSPGSDHSKWCTALDNNRPWTCIADVNRSKSQYERLGGALCVNDENIRNIFRDFVTDVEQCPK